MTGQASFDRFFFLDEDAPPVTILSQTEYERLKRLDENLKNKIELIKSMVEQPGVKFTEFYSEKMALKILESLYE
jgi:hypothetical protein